MLLLNSNINTIEYLILILERPVNEWIKIVTKATSITGYRVPKSKVIQEYEIKKSRFICWIAPATSREEAIQLVDQAKAEYPDARHHCWAYILGNPDNAASAAANDDGEPSGTAGKPILNVLQHKNIGDVVAVVIRYFGGIKLGAGGLVRAYGTATQQASELLTLIEQVPHQDVKIECDYADEPTLRRWIESQKGILLASEYSDKASLNVSLPVDCVDDLYTLTAGWKGTEIDSE